LIALFSYLRRIAFWGLSGWYVYSGPLIGIGLPVLVAWNVPNELSFRMVGFLLQLSGVVIVWIGIRGTRKNFEMPGTWAQAKAWLSSFPSYRGRTVVGGGAITSVASIGGGRLHVWSKVQEGATLEQRLEAVEENVTRIRDDLSAQQKESDDRSRAHDQALRRERADREAADNAIQAKIEEIETDGLRLNSAGLWWLFSGTVCSTFPGELASIGVAP
jgi:hypothetical protein